jgi:hypothetical protein
MITGTDVHDRPDSAFKINWTGCSRSNGIGVHVRPEHAHRPPDFLRRALCGWLFSLLILSLRSLQGRPARVRPYTGIAMCDHIFPSAAAPAEPCDHISPERRYERRC